MWSKGNGRDTAEHSILEAPDPESSPASAPGPAVEHEVGPRRARDAGEARGPGPQDRQPDGADPPVDQPEAKPPAIDQSGEQARRSLLRRHPTAVLIGVLCFAVAASGGYLYWDYAQRFESTDDAFIASRPFVVAPKVAGYITAVPVTDNQHVVAGDVIARIDDRDYRIALEQAQAQVAVAEASILNIDAQITVQEAQNGASQAQVEQAQATLVFAQQQAARYGDLAKRGSGTVQDAQQFASSLHQQEAALKSAQAALTAAQRQIEPLRAQRSSAEASLVQANAQRDQAQLNLSYTTVMAAQAGRVVNLTAAVGQFGQVGTGLSMFVPDEIWVTANFKETQLAAMRPGQPAIIRIDAYSDRDIVGHVDSVQPGSGTAFSLLPAQNATGNYVKVVQRVPVKLVIVDPPADVAIGPGMSVVPTVRVRAERSLYERLMGQS